jgi:oligogalacturonide lyase
MGEFAMRLRHLTGILAATLLTTAAAAKPVKEWVDPATGHRIVRISTQGGTSNLYFTQSAFTPKGDKMVIKTPDGISVVTLSDWSIAFGAGAASQPAVYRAYQPQRLLRHPRAR